MVIDDCEVKPDDFPNSCKGCPWAGRCKFTESWNNAELHEWG
jgi:hypothetical protein